MIGLEKVQYLRSHYDILPVPGIKSQLCFTKNKWQPGEIDQLKKDYPWLSQYYLDFIAEYDAIGIAWVVFYGSNQCGIIPIREEIEYWQEQSRGEYLPFGKDADGSIYAFNKKNEIIFFWIEDYDWEHPEFTANNVEEFIDECLLGQRYKDFNDIKDDRFYKFLQDQSWA